MNIGPAIRAELAFKGMTAAELSEAIHLDRKGLSQRLNGHVQFRLDEIEAISKTLGVPMVRLIERAEVVA